MKKCGLVFFSLYGIVVFSMEKVVDVSWHTVTFRPKDTIPLFQPTIALEDGKLWSEIVPGHLIITPDECGVIVSDPGRVRHLDLETGKISGMVKHQCIKKIPLIAVAQRQDKSLLVASACNYYSKQDKKLVAEYAVYADGFCRFAQMDAPIQAISLNGSGDLLAIADSVCVTLIDLNTKDRQQALFTRKIKDGTHRIVDIAMNAKGNHIIMAGSRGDVQLMLYGANDLKPLENVKQVNTTDKIKKIYYPCSGDPRVEDSYGELLYLTDQGKAKIVKVSELDEKDLNQQIDTIHFAESSQYDKVTADFGDQIAVAYWTDDIKMSQEIRQAIKIYRKDGEGSMSEFTLGISGVEESYTYRTSSGTLDYGIGRLLHVALRGKTVIALATDGRVRVWSLPERNKSFVEPANRATESRTHIKGRSSSAEMYSNPLISLTGEKSEPSKDSPKRGRSSSTKLVQSSPDVLVAVDKQKKSSPRFMQIIRGSRESSPSLPTHHSESTGHAQEKEVKHNDEKQYI